MCKYIDSECYCFIIKDTCQTTADKCDHAKNYSQERDSKKIYVCSPYGGKEENYLKAVEYCKYVTGLGHIPFASHVMLHGIMADTGEERERGLAAGLEMVKLVDEVWVFSDYISEGMEEEINLAHDILRKPVAFISGPQLWRIGAKE